MDIQQFVQDASTTGKSKLDKGFIIESDKPIFMSNVRLNSGSTYRHKQEH